jgi:hypothetical protein
MAVGREALRTAALEAGFVVFGVVLALVANEWRQGVLRAREAERALDAVFEELERNHAAVRASAEYHGATLGLIRAAAGGGRPLTIRDFGRGFVSAAELQRTAWDSAAATGATREFELPLVLALSHVYALQDRYERQAESVGRILYADLYAGGPGRIVANAANLASLIGAMSYRERELLEVYDETLPRLRERAARGGRP